MFKRHNTVLHLLPAAHIGPENAFFVKTGSEYFRAIERNEDRTVRVVALTPVRGLARAFDNARLAQAFADFLNCQGAKRFLISLEATQ